MFIDLIEGKSPLQGRLIVSFTSIAVAVAAMSLSSASAPAPANEAQPGALVEETQLESLYVPSGYDDNDNIQIVGEGLFLDECHRYRDTFVDIDVDRGLILLRPQAEVRDGNCLQVVKPYEAVVTLGRIPAGDYKILQGDRHDSIGHLRVDKAQSEGIDDHAYAPVGKVEFKSHMSSSGVRISGMFNSSCQELVDMPITIQDNVIVIMPIVDRNRSVDCVKGNYPFEGVTYLDFMGAGKYLLHIRSMNGQSYNKIVEVR